MRCSDGADGDTSVAHSRPSGFAADEPRATYPTTGVELGSGCDKTVAPSRSRPVRLHRGTSLGGGQLRNRIAALDSKTGLATAGIRTQTDRVRLARRVDGYAEAVPAWRASAKTAPPRSTRKPVSRELEPQFEQPGLADSGDGEPSTPPGASRRSRAPRNRIAALDQDGPGAAWIPTEKTKVGVRSPRDRLCRGTFTTIGGQGRTRIAATMRSTALRGVDPGASAQVLTRVQRRRSTGRRLPHYR